MQNRKNSPSTGDYMRMGIDVGSHYLAVVLLDRYNGIRFWHYCNHHGHIEQALRDSIHKIGLDTTVVYRVAVTGSGAGELKGCGPYRDTVVATLAGAQFLARRPVRQVISVGASSFFLILTDGEGHYLNHRTNTACASGTGAFLEQQAMRIGVSIEEFGTLAQEADVIPPVAARCSVFAKSDIIHLQQEGMPKACIVAGLCRGMTEGILDTLLGGQTLEGDTAFVGGVALNRAIENFMRERIGEHLLRVPHPQLATALGAALYAGEYGLDVCGELQFRVENVGKDKRLRRAPLTLKMSSYPQFRWADSYCDREGTEVGLIRHPGRKAKVEGVLGIDIGSTSTKAVLTDLKGEPLLFLYRKTLADPVEACRKLFRAVRELLEKHEFDLILRGVGTTGSGRKFIRMVFNG
ncbi:MAG: hypothetical protein D6820_01915, partial [Lentisphaerae bacterium]